MKVILISLLMIFAASGGAHAHEETYGTQYQYRVVASDLENNPNATREFLIDVEEAEEEGFAVHTISNSGKFWWAILRKPK